MSWNDPTATTAISPVRWQRPADTSASAAAALRSTARMRGLKDTTAIPSRRQRSGPAFQSSTAAACLSLSSRSLRSRDR